jgi:hypothetical protein
VVRLALGRPEPASSEEFCTPKRARRTVFGRDRHQAALGHRNELARFPSPLQTVRHDVHVDVELGLGRCQEGAVRLHRA